MLIIVYRLDVGSIQILERIGLLEDNILHTLQQTLSSSQATLAAEPSKRLQPHGALWTNGDVVLTWSSLLPLLRDEETALPLRAFAEQLRSCRSQETYSPKALPTSPSILETFSEQPDFKGVDTMQLSDSDDTAAVAQSCKEAEASLASEQGVAWEFLKSYMVDTHSKSPILDVGWLEQIRTHALQGGIDFSKPSSWGLPHGVNAAGVAILLLAIALGQLTGIGPQDSPVSATGYVHLALPWIGLATLRPMDIIQNLQARLLLGSYYMWTMRPWEAWCLADSLALEAEKLLTKLDHFSWQSFCTELTTDT